MAEKKEKRKLDPGLTRNLLVLAIVLGVATCGSIVGYVMLKSKKDKVAASQTINAPRDGLQERGGYTPQYANERAADERARAEDAMKKGESNMPNLVSASAPPPEPTFDASNTVPSSGQSQPVRVAPTDVGTAAPQKQSGPTQLSAADKDTIDKWVEMWSVKENPTTSGFTYVGKARSNSAAGANSAPLTSTSTTSAAGAQARKKNPLPRLHNPIIAAVTQQGLDTDSKGEVIWATVVGSNEWKGARLKGSYKRNDERIDAVYDQIWWNGEWYKITAVAVDPDDNRSTLSGSVDHRYMQRYVLPVLADAATIYGQARALNGSQQTQNINGTSSSVTITPETAAIMAGAAGVQRLSNQIQQQATQMQEQVTRSPGLVAVMVLQAETEEDATQQAASSSHAQSCSTCGAQPVAVQSAPEIVQPQKAATLWSGIGVAGPYGTTIGIGGTLQ